MLDSRITNPRIHPRCHIQPREPALNPSAPPSPRAGPPIFWVVLDRLWTAAIGRPFLEAVRDDTITDLAFDRWLGQEALLVADLLAFLPTVVFV